MSDVQALSGTPLIEWLVVITLLGGGVFVVVRFVDAVAARWLSPRIRMALYALVLLRIVLPPDFSSPVGLLGSRSAPAPAVVDTPVASTLEAPVVAVPWLSRHSETETSTATSERPSAPQSWLPWVYVAGIGLVLGVAAVRRRDLARIVAAATPAPDALALDGGRARVLVHPTAGPLAAGHRRPVIVLPQALVLRLPAAALRCVVAHERAHHEGGDPWLASALTLLCAVAWPMLPVWLAAHRVAC